MVPLTSQFNLEKKKEKVVRMKWQDTYNRSPQGMKKGEEAATLAANLPLPESFLISSRPESEQVFKSVDSQPVQW